MKSEIQCANVNIYQCANGIQEVGGMGSDYSLPEAYFIILPGFVICKEVQIFLMAMAI